MIVRINQDLCKACGICGHVCPRHIPVTIKDENKNITTISQERINLCMQCGHCVAVCPNHAIQVDSLNEEEFLSVKGLDISENEFLTLLQQRRSVRRYKDKALPREIINRIIDA
ncbi:MAG: 4Fe-4S dicluster domain-containing protein, partial [Candidatus Aminicenantaceae bacterium]